MARLCKWVHILKGPQEAPQRTRYGSRTGLEEEGRETGSRTRARLSDLDSDHRKPFKKYNQPQKEKFVARHTCFTCADTAYRYLAAPKYLRMNLVVTPIADEPNSREYCRRANQQHSPKLEERPQSFPSAHETHFIASRAKPDEMPFRVGRYLLK